MALHLDHQNVDIVYKISFISMVDLKYQSIDVTLTSSFRSYFILYMKSRRGYNVRLTGCVTYIIPQGRKSG